MKHDGVKPKAKKVKLEDLPTVQEWILAAEAAEIAGVSRQYLHNSLHMFPSAAKISGFLAFKRAEVEEWSRQRDAKLSIHS